MIKNEKLKSKDSLYNFFPKNRKGISVVIGYVLLISMAVVMSIVIYQWLKTYVPTEEFDCPADTSLFIKDYSCDSNILNLTISNNGKFNVTGYIIRVSTEVGQEVAATDLSGEILSGGTNFTSSTVLFQESSANTFGPNEEATHLYNVSGLDLYFVEVIPIRSQEDENRFRFASCTNVKVKEDLTCSG